MENLGDILRRLATTRRSSNGEQLQQPVEPEPPAPTCATCQGRGWYTRSVPAGHPDFGRIITCECQEERRREEQSTRLLRYSNLGYLTRFTFATLRPEGRGGDPEGQRMFREACQAATAYAEDPTGWLVLVGPNGAGKTHLAAAIANRCIERGRVVFFVQAPDLLDHLRSSFAPTSEVSYSDLFDQVKNTPLLVLDDLRTHTTTPWALEKLQQIINHRYNAQLPTVVTTASRLEDLDPYIRARLQAEGLSRVLALPGVSAQRPHRLGQVPAEMLKRMTFESFDVRGFDLSAEQRATLEHAYKAARNFAADPDGWLTLFSPTTGAGKTHLAVAIAGERLRRGQPVFYVFVPELLDYLRYTFSPDSPIAYDTIFEEVKNTPLLILDDLGREHSSPWAEEKLYQIIVHRHDARLPTVITSTRDFTRETGPISSRVQDPSIGSLVRMDANDYRRKGRRESSGRPSSRV